MRKWRRKGRKRRKTRRRKRRSKRRKIILSLEESQHQGRTATGSFQGKQANESS